MLKPAFALLGALLIAGHAHAAAKETWVTLSHPKKGGPVYRLPGNRAAFFYRTSDFSTDYDGSPRAYHPKGRKGGALDHTANAGGPGNWYGVVTQNGRKNGNPIVQSASHPAPGFYVSPTALADRTRKASDPHRYVDASAVPYASLPPNVQNIKGGNREGANQGDFGTVVNVKTGKVVHVIVADSGPRNKIGEGSMALRKALGLRGSIDLVWIIYPGSRRSPAWPVPAREIQREGERRFSQLGGLQRVRALFGSGPN